MPRTNLGAGLKELRAQMMHVGLQVEDSLAKSLKAIETGNHASLLLIIEADESIDATFAQRMTYLLWIAHKLAEVATYVADICQRVTFIVEGQMNIQLGS